MNIALIFMLAVIIAMVIGMIILELEESRKTKQLLSKMKEDIDRMTEALKKTTDKITS
ncbi:MAG: hypothetical protein LBI60_02925 [Bacteroidales bacterium]|nr:hypothetical protein [Bacteroidales bacterium]